MEGIEVLLLARGSAGLRFDLDSDLDGVNRLDNSGGSHSGETSNGEGLDVVNPGELSL